MKDSTRIPALVPGNGTGHQFVCYADCCSGVPGAPHERTFAAVNAVVARLQPQPEFICFPGDEIRGLVADDEQLREQWRYWFDREMVWLDRETTPLYHTTGNHTVYDAASEAVFRQVMAHLPQNGPPDQKGLSYSLRRDDLLLVFVNTMWLGTGGEGSVETTWLDATLEDHADARHKLVIGHHPVFPVNGFSGPFQREIGTDNGRSFWQVLVRHNVLAYICSHILAFDIQVHDGVLQLLTAGAGTSPQMPNEAEYLHCVQAALDFAGLRYQVLDTSAQIREWLTWPMELPPSAAWQPLEGCDEHTGVSSTAEHHQARIVIWRFTGECRPDGGGEPQTLLCGFDSKETLAPLWLGLRGNDNLISVLLRPAPGRSPHLWTGPTLPPGKPFDIQVAIHGAMGPGGLLWRWNDSTPWSSLSAASHWGAEKLAWPSLWQIGYDQRGYIGQPFRGSSLRVTRHDQFVHLRNTD